MKHGLAARVMALFVLALFPVTAASTWAFLWSDQVMQDTLSERIAATIASVGARLGQERARLRNAAADWLHGPIPAEVAALGTERGFALPAGVDLFEVAVARPGEPAEIVFSLHLPVAVGDRPDRWVGGTRSIDSGYARILVRGNPPRAVPALVAHGRTRTPSGTVSVLVGTRLDGDRLGLLSSASGAQLVLSDPQLFSETASPRQAHDAAGASLALDAVRGPEARIDLWIPPGPWSSLRRRITWTGGLALATSGLTAILMALFFSRTITRPIRALSQAASRVAEGDLNARVSFRGQGEIGRLGLDFNDMTHRLARQQDRLRRAERTAAWREVARRVAHEVKNPLFPIRLAAETVRKGVRRDHPDLKRLVEESTETILKEVDAIDRLVSEFTQFARMPAPTPRPATVAELWGPLRASYGPSGVAFDDRCGPNTVIEADAEQLRQVLHNLIQNAREARPEDGAPVRIQVTAAPAEGGLELRVEDDGPGLPSDADPLFEPYFTTKSRGTGLGLAIVERIVSEHGGSIQAGRSAHLGGASFRVWLPRGPGRDGRAPASAPTSALETRPGSAAEPESDPRPPKPPSATPPAHP